MISTEEMKRELLLMKEELETRLAEKDQKVNPKLAFYMKEELKDVEYALKKLSLGKYGICEKTFQEIPLEKLQIMPTARTLDDFSIQAYFEKRIVFNQ
ncbi:hypothetical protein [Bacillus alveayuensis]|uniref:RNA polymerase-binding transcription factor DksA n=1 Tax=Aeribacillus alveayuensis TaxID=279215 RepID=A0ABT9VLB4_9BACI|nr:hypothetical protein [Bacillus alveayuensis]MDQ0161657.1 RNA polymerase-binding transcription factor DksA [Bacillus alveayuensis]